MIDFACPACGRRMLSADERCGGSFLDTDHPSSVAPIVVALVAVDALLTEAAVRAAAMGGSGFGLHPSPAQARKMIEAAIEAAGGAPLQRPALDSARCPCGTFMCDMTNCP